MSWETVIVRLCEFCHISAQCLLMLMDSPLNRAGLLQVYVHTEKNVLVEVNPSTRIPRTFERFCGLMGMIISLFLFCSFLIWTFSSHYSAVGSFTSCFVLVYLDMFLCPWKKTIIILILEKNTGKYSYCLARVHKQYSLLISLVIYLIGCVKVM